MFASESTQKGCRYVRMQERLKQTGRNKRNWESINEGYCRGSDYAAKHQWCYGVNVAN